jgi:elongation factor Ts
VVITANDVKALREKTGAGIMECKRALEEAGGNVEKATEFLRQQGLAKADKKAGRTAAQGVIEPYIHAGGRIGAIVEINCETDFVARTQDFKTLAHDIAMQVVASNPLFISEDEIPAEAWPELEREYGERKRALEAVSLFDQPFVKDSRWTVRDLIKESIGKLGENIVVRRFARFEVGAGQPETAGTDD